MIFPVANPHDIAENMATRDITIRLQPEQLAALDAWIARHPDPKPSRPEAIRQVLAGALGGSQPVVADTVDRDRAGHRRSKYLDAIWQFVEMVQVKR